MIDVDPGTLSEVELARFTLMPDGTIQAVYRSEFDRVELSRLFVASAGGWVSPSDGQRYFDALDTVYSTSSFMYVKDL